MSNINDFIIEDGVLRKYIGSNPDVVIPDGVTKIEQSTFARCTGLNGTLTLPANCTSIEAYAFDGCTGLSGRLIIPDSVTTIAREAFDSCKGFTSLTLSASSSVMLIERETFVLVSTAPKGSLKSFDLEL